MSKSSSFRYAIFAVAASIICGFFHSLPLFGIPPTQASYAAAIRGLASLRKLEGYGEASVIDLAARRLWQAGGASMLATGQWLAVFAGWTLAALAVFAVVHAIVRLLDDKRVRGILFGSTVVLVLATCVPPLWEMFTRRSERISDLRLLVPLELADRFAKLIEKGSLRIQPHLRSSCCSFQISETAFRWRTPSFFRGIPVNGARSFAG